MVTSLFRQMKATERKAKGLFHMRQSGFDQSFINMKADNEYDTRCPTPAGRPPQPLYTWWNKHNLTDTVRN